jgi:hypothetical protein
MTYTQKLQEIMEAAKSTIREFCESPRHNTSFVIGDPAKAGQSMVTKDPKEIFWLADNPTIVEVADSMHLIEHQESLHHSGKYFSFLKSVIAAVAEYLKANGEFELPTSDYRKACDPEYIKRRQLPYYTLSETGNRNILIRRVRFDDGLVIVMGEVLESKIPLLLRHTIEKLIDVDFIRFADILLNPGQE